VYGFEMKSSHRFRHYPERPSQLTPEFAQKEYDRLLAEIPSAEAAPQANQWIKLYKNWDAFESYASSERARINYKYSGRLSDKALENADTFMREKVIPVTEKNRSRLIDAVMKTRHREALVSEFGEQLFSCLETEVKPLDPRLAELRVEEARLKNDYRKIVGTAEIPFRGEKYTLTSVQKFRTSPDAELRRDSFFAHRQWFVEHRDEIAKIFDQLVQVRQKMAKKIDDSNFIDLGYQRMGRTDYGTKESAAFRKLVLDLVVPIQTRLHEEQAKQLGTAKLRPWDADYDPSLVLPMNAAPTESQLEKAQRVFDRISPRLSHHFSMMREAELIDLENRPGKATGAFCTSFPDERRSAILCNSTGEASNVGTLMHEMGHAFQSLESMQDERPLELLWPTMDAAEIHSMGMEYLSMSRMDEFFTAENAEKFRKERWKHGIELICYVAVVDEFQHWVYENSSASLDDRDQTWTGLVKKYQPSFDYSGFEKLVPMRWYMQNHIFGSPFYYIDYAIAETGAMQLALLDAVDPKKAVEVYLELCRLGGAKSVLKIFSSAGLQSPFSAENMKKLMEYGSEQLGLV
jgi:M3 family oligoendopeptidase